MHELKIYRGVMCNDTEEWWKSDKELTCCFKIDICWPKYIMFEQKSTEELCFMALNIGAKFEGKLTCALKKKSGICPCIYHTTPCKGF